VQVKTVFVEIVKLLSIVLRRVSRVIASDGASFANLVRIRAPTAALPCSSCLSLHKSRL
jgi:hypothetical protein